MSCPFSCHVTLGSGRPWTLQTNSVFCPSRTKHDFGSTTNSGAVPASKTRNIKKKCNKSWKNAEHYIWPSLTFDLNFDLERITSGLVFYLKCEISRILWYCLLNWQRRDVISCLDDVSFLRRCDATLSSQPGDFRWGNSRNVALNRDWFSLSHAKIAWTASHFSRFWKRNVKLNIMLNEKQCIQS